MSFAVYKHFDADGQPLYVGYSGNVDARQQVHKRAPWWRLSAKMEVVDCHKEDLAKEYERREIYRLRPRFNHQHNPDKGNWTPPSRPRADRPNETDRVLWIMQNKPLWEWPAEYRADYCRILSHAQDKPHYIRDYPKRIKAFQKLWTEDRIKDMTGQQIVDHLNAADPKAPKMNSPQVFYNWRRNGFPGFDAPGEE